MNASAIDPKAPVISLWVPGRPKTKGSMRVVNARRAVLQEGVDGSVRWRQLVAYAARSALRPDAPVSGPVAVELSFHLPVDPLGARAGDIDKLTRNVLDALSACSKGCAEDCRNHAGAYVDDNQVVSLGVGKHGPMPDTPGVNIMVWSISGTS